MSLEDLTIPATVLADADLRPAAKLMLARLARLARGGGLVFRARRLLAADLGLSEREAEGALAQLEARGRIWMEVSHAGRARPKGYRVLRRLEERPAGVETVPVDGPLGVRPAKPVQLTLFDSTPLPTAGDGAGSESHRGPAR